MIGRIRLSKLEAPFFEQYAKKVYETLEGVKEEYPDFSHWYWNKVFPELKSGGREILVLELNEEIIAASILKANEKKICCLVVSQKYRSREFGEAILLERMELLKTDAPLISISSSKISDFAPLINKYEFRLYEEIENCYNQELLNMCSTEH